MSSKPVHVVEKSFLSFLGKREGRGRDGFVVNHALPGSMRPARSKARGRRWNVQSAEPPTPEQRGRHWLDAERHAPENAVLRAWQSERPKRNLGAPPTFTEIISGK
jgi:hypothetical protein